MSIFAGIRARQTTLRAAGWPCEDFPVPVKRVIADAIRLAWQRVCAHCKAVGDSPAKRSEPELTTLLQEELRQLREDPAGATCGFTGSMFQDVARDASEVSFDGQHLEKRPDLAIRLADPYPGNSSDRVLFVECKLIGVERPVSEYGSKGISRFVAGEYAWAMSSAIMLAYAARGYTVAKKLTPHLRKAKDKNPDPYQTRALPRGDAVLSNGTKPRVYASRHQRTWKYIQTGKSPGDITLHHLWLPLL